MATRTIANGGGLWNATGTWVEGIVPTSADDVVATATSGTLTLSNSLNQCKTLNFTNYTGTFAMTSNGVSVAGDVTLVSGMTLTGTGTGTLTVNAATVTLTSAGKTLPARLTSTFVGAVITLADNWTIAGLITVSNTATFIGNTIFAQTSITINAALTGSTTTAFVMTGTGTLICFNANTYFTNSLTINTAGTITLGTHLSLRGATFTYTAGTVATTGNTVQISGSSTINAAGITFNNVNITTTSTVTLNSLFTLSGTLTISAGIVATFDGTAGFTAANLTLLTATALTHILKNGITYTVTSSFTSKSAPTATHPKIKSDSAGIMAIFTLSQSASCTVIFLDATDIDSSAGRTVNSFGGTLSNTNNWSNITDLNSIIRTFVS